MSLFTAGDGDGQFVHGHEPGEATFDWDAARRFPGPQPERARPQRQAQAEGPRDVTHLAGWVAAQHEGNRNAGLFWAACRAVEAGDSTALDAMARAAAAAGLTEQEITRTIRSAQRGPERRPFGTGRQLGKAGGQEMFGRRAARERQAAEQRERERQRAAQLAAEVKAEREQGAGRRARRQPEGGRAGPEPGRSGSEHEGVSYDPESGALTITGARIASGRIGERGAPSAGAEVRSAARVAREATRGAGASRGQTVISAADQVTITGSSVAGGSVSITGSEVTVDGSSVVSPANRDTEPEAG